MPAFMWVATIGAVVQCNAIPVICEIDESFNIDPVSLEKAITPRTKLIVAVHMAGAPCDMAEIMRIADSRGIGVLEDCAQCNGGSFAGRKVGTFGKVGMFSLQINKNVTSGEGGILVTSDDETYGRLSAIQDLGVPWKNAAPASDNQVVSWGQGRRMPELSGAVANVQLGKLPKVVEHMRASKYRIRKALSAAPDIEFRRITDEAGDTGPFLIIIMPNTERASQVVARATDAGLIGVTRIEDYGLHVYYNIPQLVNKIPLSPAGNPWSLQQNQERDYQYGKGTCPASDELFERSVVIPIPSRLTGDQEKECADILLRALAC